MREVAALPDPVGAVLRKIVRPNGLIIEKTAVPMGVGVGGDIGEHRVELFRQKMRGRFKDVRHAGSVLGGQGRDRTHGVNAVGGHGLDVCLDTGASAGITACNVL